MGSGSETSACAGGAAQRAVSAMKVRLFSRCRRGTGTLQGTLGPGEEGSRERRHEGGRGCGFSSALGDLDRGRRARPAADRRCLRPAWGGARHEPARSCRPPSSGRLTLWTGLPQGWQDRSYCPPGPWTPGTGRGRGSLRPDCSSLPRVAEAVTGGCRVSRCALTVALARNPPGVAVKQDEANRKVPYSDPSGELVYTILSTKSMKSWSLPALPS